MTALVVSARKADRFGAGAEGGYGDGCGDNKIEHILGESRAKEDIVIKQA